MRVIAGEKKGIRLASFHHASIRPTTDRVKETIFNVLGEVTRASDVLDIFAGTGSLGIEALSRGAARAIFIEKNPAAQKAIVQNIQLTGYDNKIDLLKMPVKRGMKLLAARGQIFDLIFADPPYADTVIDETIHDIMTYNLLRQGGWFVLEHSVHSKINDSIYPLACRIKKSQGETEVSFYQNG